MQPRNALSRGVHGFLGCDGIAPGELRRRALASLAPYDIELFENTVVGASRRDEDFVLTTETGLSIVARKMLLATGIKDCVPNIPGIDALYGNSVFQCAYCDGWEVRDRPIAAYGGGDSCAEFALALTTWSSDVILFTDGNRSPDLDVTERLQRYGIHVRTEKILRLEGEAGKLEYVCLANGERVLREAMFIHLGQHQRSPLAEQLGLVLENDELVKTDVRQRTQIPGLFVAGDAVEDVKFAIVAAAQGARAAHAINQELREEDTR
jgi:thioredoxin reductase